MGPDEPIDRSRLAFDVQFLREALDPSDRVLEQDFERRAAPVRERIALEIIVARQRDELHRLAEVLIPAQLEPPETIVLGERTVEDEPGADVRRTRRLGRSEEHTSELQSLMRNSDAVFWLNKK